MCYEMPQERPESLWKLTDRKRYIKKTSTPPKSHISEVQAITYTMDLLQITTRGSQSYVMTQLPVLGWYGKLGRRLPPTTCSLPKLVGCPDAYIYLNIFRIGRLLIICIPISPRFHSHVVLLISLLDLDLRLSTVQWNLRPSAESEITVVIDENCMPQT